MKFMKMLGNNKNMKSGCFTLAITAALIAVVFVSGCTQTTGPLVLDVSFVLDNAESYYENPVILRGQVSELGELFCSCFKLTSGGKSVQVWYDSMVKDDGTEMPAVSVAGIQNGDWVIVSGMLKRAGQHSSLNDFWALHIEKTEPVTSSESINSFVDCIAAGYPVMESYPRQCKVPGGRTFTEGVAPETASTLTGQQARAIAEASACVENGTLAENGTVSYNQFTKTWWFDLDMDEPLAGCSPACVVFEETNETEINWRCTGLLA